MGEAARVCDTNLQVRNEKRNGLEQKLSQVEEERMAAEQAKRQRDSKEGRTYLRSSLELVLEGEEGPRVERRPSRGSKLENMSMRSAASRKREKRPAAFS